MGIEVEEPVKTEMFYQRNWSNTSVAQFMEKVAAYISGTTRDARSCHLARWALSSTGQVWE